MINEQDLYTAFSSNESGQVFIPENNGSLKYVEAPQELEQRLAKIYNDTLEKIGKSKGSDLSVEEKKSLQSSIETVINTYFIGKGSYNYRFYPDIEAFTEKFINPLDESNESGTLDRSEASNYAPEMKNSEEVKIYAPRNDPRPDPIPVHEPEPIPGSDAKVTFSDRSNDQIVFLPIKKRSFWDKIIGGYNYRQAPDQIDGSLVGIYKDFLKQSEKAKGSELSEEEKQVLMRRINTAIIDYVAKHPQGQEYVPYETIRVFDDNFINPLDKREEHPTILDEKTNVAEKNVSEQSAAQDAEEVTADQFTDAPGHSNYVENLGNGTKTPESTIPAQNQTGANEINQGDPFAKAPWRSGFVDGLVQAQTPKGGKTPAETANMKIDVNDKNINNIILCAPTPLQKKLKEMGLLDEKEKWLNSRKLREKMEGITLTEAQKQELQSFCQEEYKKVKSGAYSKKSSTKTQTSAPKTDEKISYAEMTAGMKCPNLSKGEVRGWTHIGNDTWDMSGPNSYYKVTRGKTVKDPTGKEVFCNEYLFKITGTGNTKKVYGKFVQYPSRVPDSGEILFCEITGADGVVKTYDKDGKLIKTENKQKTPVTQNKSTQKEEPKKGSVKPKENEGR